MNNPKQQSVVHRTDRQDKLPVYRIMMLAGETSGDGLAAGLVKAIHCQITPDRRLEFFGAGGERMREAGVHILEDLTKRTVFGLSEVVSQYFWFKKVFDRLLEEAFVRQPDIIILTDYAGFNLRFAEAVRKRLNLIKGDDSSWQPKILYYVSPQVWA